MIIILHSHYYSSLLGNSQATEKNSWSTANLLNRDILASFDAIISGIFHAIAELDESSDIRLRQLYNNCQQNCNRTSRI